MAVLTDSIEERMQHMEMALAKQIHEAKLRMDGELPHLEYQREMLEMEKYKIARRYEFDDAYTKQALSFKMTAAQRLELEEKKRGEEFLRSEREAERRKNLLEAPHNACALSVAVNLWIVKFGDGWVRIDDLPNGSVGPGEMQWLKLLTRLTEANKIEKLEDYVRVVT